MTARSYENQKQAAAELDESYSAAIYAIEAIDFNKVDKLVLCFGLNDYLGDVKLGDGESRDTETFRGALAYALEKICSVYTDLQIYLTTPVFCIFDNGADSDNEKNKCSATLADYAEAVILSARSFKLPAVDNYSNLGINSVNHKYYYINIYLCTPIYRAWTDAQNNHAFINDSDTKVYGGYKLTDYVQAIKDVGDEYHLPVIDLYYELGINRQNRLNYFPKTDGTHPNALGRYTMAKFMAEKIF